MIALIERVTGVNRAGQGPAFLVAGGHGATHWIMGVVYVLLPFIRDDLGLSYAATGGIISIFHISAFAANGGSGALVDITGRRVLLQAISLVIGGAALMVMGLADGIWLLWFLVVFIGITNNLWHPAAISYLSERYQQSRGYVLSVHTLGASFGDILSPLAAGALLVVFSWQGAATVSALPVFIMAAVLYFLLAGRRRRDATEVSESMGFRQYLGNLGALLKTGPVIGLCIMAAFRSMAQNGLMLFLPLLMKNVLGFGSVLLGVAAAAMQVGGVISGPLGGIVSDRIGRRPVVLAGMAASTVVVASITFIADTYLFVVVVFVLGFVLFAVRPVIHSWAMDMTPKDMSGTAISLLFGTQSAFSAAVPVVGGLVADIWGLETAFYGLAVCIGIAAVICVRLPDNRQA